MKKHTNIWNEIEMNEPEDHSNLYVGIAIGVILTFCAGVWCVVSVLEAVRYGV